MVMLAVLANSSWTSVRSLVRTLALIFRITTLGPEATSGVGLDAPTSRALRAHVSSLRNHPSSLLLSKTIAVSPLGRVRVAIALVLFGMLTVASLMRLTRAGAGIRFSCGIFVVLRMASGRRLDCAVRVGRGPGRLVGPGPGLGAGGRSTAQAYVGLESGPRKLGGVAWGTVFVLARRRWVTKDSASPACWRDCLAMASNVPAKAAMAVSGMPSLAAALQQTSDRVLWDGGTGAGRALATSIWAVGAAGGSGARGVGGLPAAGRLADAIDGGDLVEIDEMGAQCLDIVFF